MSWPSSIIGSPDSSASRSARLIASPMVSATRVSLCVVVVIAPSNVVGTDSSASLHRMRIGVDSYSYHRLLGELRPGEPPPPGPPLARGALDLVAECRELGVDLCALETCFLPPPAELDLDALRAEAGGMELALSWGAPNGLEFGASAMALDDLLAWLEL